MVDLRAFVCLRGLLRSPVQLVHCGQSAGLPAGGDILPSDLLTDQSTSSELVELERNLSELHGYRTGPQQCVCVQVGLWVGWCCCPPECTIQDRTTHTHICLWGLTLR